MPKHLPTDIALPIATGGLQFVTVRAAQQLFKYEEGKPRETWAPKTDSNGELLWGVQLIAMGDGGAGMIEVSLPGDPGVKPGEMVAIDGMTARAWEMKDKDGKEKNGISFRATAIRPVQARGEKAAA